MSETKIERFLEKLAEKLRSSAIADDFTGKITLNVQQGGLSPKVEVEMHV